MKNPFQEISKATHGWADPNPMSATRRVVTDTALKPGKQLKRQVTGKERNNNSSQSSKSRQEPFVPSGSPTSAPDRSFGDMMRRSTRGGVPVNRSNANPLGEVQPWLDYGRTRGEDLFSYDPARQQEETAMLDRYRGRMSGVSDPEFDLMRERAMRGQQNQLAQNLQIGASQAGRAGVRGAAAMGLQRQAMDQAQQQSRLQENDLALMQMDRQREAEKSFADYLNQLSTAEDMRRMGQFASEMGFGGLGMQDLGQQRGLEAAKAIAAMPDPNLPADKPWSQGGVDSWQGSRTKQHMDMIGKGDISGWLQDVTRKPILPWEY